MAKRGFALGDALSGLIIDGREETPFLTGTLSFEERKGIRLSIPFLYFGAAQFDSVNSWIHAGRPPSNLQLLTEAGPFTLYGCRISSSSLNFGGGGFSTAHITPKEIVFKDRDGDFEDDLAVTELRSQIDGLTEWTAFGATTFAHDADQNNRVQKISVQIESKEPLEWRHGHVKFSLSTDWKTDQEEPGFRVREWVCLTTTFADSRPCSEHLAEQRKMIALLTLMFGASVAFRRHDIRDERFNQKVLTGKVVDVPFYEMVSDDTVGDLWRPPAGKLKDPLATASDLDTGALERWLASYDEWHRVIQPSVGTLRRAESYVEDHILNSSMSLEAAGHLLGAVEGEKATHNRGRPTTATYVFRSLATLGLDWSEVAESPLALARAIAGNYNDVKHYDRGAFPPSDHTYVAGKIALLLVRLLALRLLDPTMGLVKRYGEDWKFRRFKEQIQSMNLYVGADGKFGLAPVVDDQQAEA